VARKKKENEISAQQKAASAEKEEVTETPAEGAQVEETPPVVKDEELEAARGEASRNWDLYLRAQADLENYRRRSQREKEDLAKFANEAILREILPVMDNLERALQHAGSAQEAGGLVQGVEMTMEQLRKVLEKFGVKAIDAVGEPFDPARHEAMGQVETEEYPPNTVTQVLQGGYLLNERLLRPSLVMIAKAPARESQKNIEQ
jgi:molecular chaperone GrpE